MNSYRYSIDLLLALCAPLHISEPGSAHYNPSTGRYVKGAGAFAITRTKRMPLAGDAADVDDDGNTKGKSTGYVPGSSIRGALRRQAADTMFAALIAKGEKVSFDLYHIIMCGAASASPGKAATVSETAESAEHPFISMFGGGPKMIWSRLSAGNAWPITPDTLTAGLVPSSLAGMSSPGRTVTQHGFVKVDDLLRGSARKPSDVVADFDAELEGWLAKLKASGELRDRAAAGELEEGEVAGKKVGLQGYQYKEVMVPGLRLHSEHFLDTELAKLPMLGLYVLALVGFANEQRLGGGYREGCGRFALEAKLRREGAPEVTLLQRGAQGYAANLSDPFVAEAVTAWQTYAAEKLTAAQLQRLFLYAGKEAAAE